MNIIENVTTMTEDNVLYQRNLHEYNNMSDGALNDYLIEVTTRGIDVALLPTDDDNRKEEKMNDGAR